jgi:hypothetical protein
VVTYCGEENGISVEEEEGDDDDDASEAVAFGKVLHPRRTVYDIYESSPTCQMMICETQGRYLHDLMLDIYLHMRSKILRA